MKTLMIFPFICLSLVSRSKAVTLPFEEIAISPFFTNKETTIVVNTDSSYLRFLVFIQNDKYMNLCIAQDTITSPGVYTYSYDNSYTRSKNKVYVRYSTGGEYNDTSRIERTLGRSSYHLITDNQSYTSQSSIAILDGNLNWTEKKATYEFDGFEGIYVPAYYHKIDLEDFYFSVEGIYQQFINFSGSLVIKNYNNVFKDVSGANETATFDLKIVNEAPDYTFALKNDMYVDPESLLMSSTQKDGYVKTKHIYLPRNEMQNQDKFEFNLVLNNFGIDKDLVVHHLDVKALKNIFGDCNNSKYCVVRENV